MGATPFEAMKAAGHAKPATTWLYTVTDAERERAHVKKMLERLTTSEAAHRDANAKLLAAEPKGPVQ